MPAPLKACNQPWCPNLITTGAYCEAHKPNADHYRGNSDSRGYDSTWRKFRAWFIQRHPLCADCLIVATKDVHHVKKVKEFPELRLVESNCMGLCSPCHKARTARGE